MAGRAAPCETTGQLKHFEYVSGTERRQHFGVGIAGEAQCRRARSDLDQRRGIMRCEYAISEADIGQVTARGLTPRIDLDRAARQRESVTRRRVVCRCWRRRRR